MTECSLPLDLEALAGQREFARRVARALVHDEHIAEDIAQDAVVSALASRPAALRSMRAWIGRVARHRALRWRRREELRRTRERAAARPESADERSTRDLELQRELLEALGALEAHYRTALYLRYFEERSPSRIAAELGLPLATVKTRLQRGLALLRVELERRHGGAPRAWLPALTLFAFPTGGGGALGATASLAAFALPFPKLWLSAALLLACLGFSWWVSPRELSESAVPEFATASPAPEAAEALGRGAESIARREADTATEPETRAREASLREASTPLLRGRCVAAETGQPLARCRIRLSGKAMNANIAALNALRSWSAPEELLTGADGSFALRFDPPVGWELSLSVQGPGRVLQRATFDIHREPSSRDLGDLALLRGQSLTGIVRDASGAPVPGVWVYLGDLPLALGERARLFGNQKSVALSDAAGRFELDSAIPAGTWTLEVGGPNVESFEPRHVTVPETLDAASIDLRVERRELPWIEGVVVDEHGVGVPRVLVGATAPDGSADGRSSGTRADGSFRIRASKPSTAAVQLSILDPGECEMPLETLEPCCWGEREVRLELRRGLALDLRVVERGSGEPVLEYAVSCWKLGSRRPMAMALLHAGRHEHGRVELSGIERGRNLLHVHPLGRDLLRSAPVEFEASSEALAPILVEVERLAPLRVRVVDGTSAAVVGAAVEAISLGGAVLGPRTAVFDRFVHTWMPDQVRPELLVRSSTDAEGRAAVGVPAWREGFVVRVDHPAFAPRIVELASSSVGAELVVELARGGSIAGRIRLGERDSHTVRCEIFRVEEARELGRRPSERLVELQADGSFFVSGLDPGDYTAELSAISGPLVPLPNSSGSMLVPLQTFVPKVSVTEGQTSEMEIDLEARSPATLHVRVVLEGAPWTRAELRLLGRGVASGPHELDAAGRCSISGIVPGTYAARLHVVRAGSSRASIYEGTERLDLAPGAALHQELRFVHRRATLLLFERDGTTPAILRDLTVIGVHGREDLRTDAEGRIVLEGAPSTQITICEGFGGRLGKRLATCVLPPEPRDPELRVTLGGAER